VCRVAAAALLLLMLLLLLLLLRCLRLRRLRLRLRLRLCKKVLGLSRASGRDGGGSEERRASAQAIGRCAVAARH